MKEVITLDVKARNVQGKQVKQLRRDGVVPGIIYGPKSENPIPVQIDWQILRPTLMKAGGTSLLQLNVDSGEQVQVLVRDVQRHPVRQDVVMHIDFYAVDTEQVINVTVPIVIPNQEAVAKRLEAKIFQPLGSVEIETLPANIPSQIVVDMSLLKEAGDNITVGQLPVPEGVTVLADPDIAVIRSVSLANLLLDLDEEEDEEGEIDGDMPEVEVIGRGREDEEGEEV